MNLAYNFWSVQCSKIFLLNCISSSPVLPSDGVCSEDTNHPHPSFTGHTAYCTLHTAHCTLHTAHYMHTTHYLHTEHCMQYTDLCTLQTAQCTLHTKYHLLLSIQGTTLQTLPLLSTHYPVLGCFFSHTWVQLSL